MKILVLYTSTYIEIRLKIRLADPELSSKVEKVQSCLLPA